MSSLESGIVHSQGKWELLKCDYENFYPGRGIDEVGTFL